MVSKEGIEDFGIHGFTGVVSKKKYLEANVSCAFSNQLGYVHVYITLKIQTAADLSTTRVSTLGVAQKMSQRSLPIMLHMQTYEARFNY